ncbi:hypothetical protein ACFQ1R_11165 [Mariniflexile jejuense]|uniref:YD repeat-containing protein n=1 Tax=Mariniflexile jejuense TaxID=1173582 RepID=A0ABW3JL72_9FLAO
MKPYISILLILVLSFYTHAQKIDIINAPLNPVAFKYKLEDFNLKNVFAYNEKFFKNGLLMYDNEQNTKQYYKYNDDGLLLEDSNENTYTFNEKNQLIAIIGSKYQKGFFPTNRKFEYDANGRLVTKTDVSNNSDIYYTYNEAGQLKSQIIKYNGIESQITLFTYSKENNLLKIKAHKTYKGKDTIEEELLFFDRGILVKRIDEKGKETTWKTKTDAQGNYLQEMDITFNKSEISTGLNFSYRVDKRIVYYNNTSPETVFINGKPASFIPVVYYDNRKIFFDIFNQDYYNVYQGASAENGFKISILAKNKEAIAIKPKKYNPFHPTDKVYHLVYAGIIRNQGGFMNPFSHINVHETDYKSLILYDRFFEKNYFIKINSDEPVYILNDALPVMFYVTEEKAQKYYHFVKNGEEINPSRLNLAYANNNEDATVEVDNKLMYYIKGLKNLENKKVYYPTIL